MPGEWLGNPLPPYPFFCQERYPFRRNHRLKAHFVDYCFVSKYFRQQSLYKQHIRSFSLRKSSMPLSHSLFPSPTLAAYPKTCHFFKNTTWASTRQYDEYPGCVTMLHLAPPPAPSLKSLSYAPAHERLVHALNVWQTYKNSNNNNNNNDNGTVDELFF